MQYTGSRLTATECEKHHIVTKACHLDDLMNDTLTFCRKPEQKARYHWRDEK